MIVSLIVAASENQVIGRDNQLPWHLPADLKYFKKITSGHCIIMGRKTYDSIGRPLPNRTNIVLSSNKNLKITGCTVVHTLNEAIDFAKATGEGEAFIIGGASIYDAALPLTNKIYLTRVHTIVEGDTFFPELHESIWKTISKESHHKDEKHAYPFSFITLEKNSYTTQ
ncbi:MAG: dihydrofolate reductase [Bacteroidota bacterium]